MGSRLAWHLGKDCLGRGSFGTGGWDQETGLEVRVFAILKPLPERQSNFRESLLRDFRKHLAWFLRHILLRSTFATRSQPSSWEVEGSSTPESSFHLKALLTCNVAAVLRGVPSLADRMSGSFAPETMQMASTEAKRGRSIQHLKPELLLIQQIHWCLARSD